MVTQTVLATARELTVKRRGKAVLGPVSFDLGAGGVTLVVGPNGAGKTTLLKVLHGVERISRGTLDWAVPDDVSRQTQAYVFQSPIMLRRSVRQNLAYPLELLSLPKVEVAARVAEWAQKIGLQEVLDFPAPRLSGGEKQKLALGRALIRRPEVLFLDEPCANLDGRSTREIEALLIDAKEAGTRIIMTTHDLGQARRLASDVLFLVGGQVLERGAAAAFFAAPRTEEAKLFLAGEIVG